MFFKAVAAWAVVCFGTLPCAGAAVDYVRDIQPLLAKHCLMCHGPQQQMSGFRLDSREAALKGGGLGVDIVPGNGSGSRLIRFVSGAEKRVMPPVGARLSAAEIALLRAWIDEGVKWPAQTQTHWAFRKIARPDPPAVKDRAWGRNAIDSFILARLEKENVAPSPEASKRTLLRRASLDITGLLPTSAEAEDFVRDTRP
ncbi:MAG TPA: DUF1549 domain-containing protein, partial [Bryobacteraceae bacterium]